MKIILRPTEEPENWVCGEGKEFWQAAQDFLQKLALAFGDEAYGHAEMYEGLALLAKGEETEYSHYDMGDPETAFSMRLIYDTKS